uniref:hypothetical protein n=1 Tax=Ornithinimicrobium sp. CNJ-824 TaxID=1904966 RepID=UPI00117CEB4B|nr:hypothetical protein [Ornithinimicrobium sp. CNJ-824]
MHHVQAQASSTTGDNGVCTDASRTRPGSATCGTPPSRRSSTPSSTRWSSTRWASTSSTGLPGWSTVQPASAPAASTASLITSEPCSRSRRRSSSCPARARATTSSCDGSHGPDHPAARPIRRTSW